jgi:hypothetical protein
MRHPLSAKVGTNFANKRRSLGWYNSRLRTQATEFFQSNFSTEIWYQQIHVMSTKLTASSLLSLTGKCTYTAAVSHHNSSVQQSVFNELWFLTCYVSISYLPQTAFTHFGHCSPSYRIPSDHNLCSPTLILQLPHFIHIISFIKESMSEIFHLFNRRHHKSISSKWWRGRARLQLQL